MGNNIDTWLAELNPQQREGVTYGNGPLLIVAGAGTGKTRTLANCYSDKAVVNARQIKLMLD